MNKNLYLTKELAEIKLLNNKDKSSYHLIAPDEAKGMFVLQDQNNLLYRYLKENNFNHQYKISKVNESEFLEDLEEEPFWSKFIKGKFSKTLLHLYEDDCLIGKFILIRIIDTFIIVYKEINKKLKTSYLEILLEYFGDNVLVAEFSNENKDKSSLFDIYPFHLLNITSFKLLKDFYDSTKDLRIKEIIYNGMASEVNLKNIVYNNYKIYEPFSEVADDGRYEIISDSGYDMMLLSYQDALNYPVEVENSNFYQFKKYLNFIEEFQGNDFIAELAMVENYGGQFLVYKVNNQIVSGGVLEIVGQEIAYFSYAFTLPEKRGNHYFDFILKALNSYSYNNRKNILLSVYNPIAIKKYLQYGFKKTGYILSK